ncbi:MAG: hypothetical protein N2039_04855 [Gemmataceae bacterium]|nr:hypothetical protein [Gemmataceae bacterium]
MTPDELESDPRFPSGKWHGFWTQTVPVRAKPQQEMILTFRRGVIQGEGRDMVGPFLIRGSYSTADGKCHWTKRYVGKHDVFYRGFNEGKGIWGTWEIADEVVLRGGFHIWPDGMTDPTGSTLAEEADLPVGELIGAK